MVQKGYIPEMFSLKQTIKEEKDNNMLATLLTSQSMIVIPYSGHGLLINLVMALMLMSICLEANQP